MSESMWLFCNIFSLQDLISSSFDIYLVFCALHFQIAFVRTKQEEVSKNVITATISYLPI